MFIGHLPAGYILTKKLQNRFNFKKYLWIGLVASIFPDLDIFYFYFVDNRQTLHHEYWIHLPFYWLMIAIIAFVIVGIINRKEYLIAFYFFFSNIFLHLLLDTMTGKVEWLYPFSKTAFYFFDVPTVYNFWVYNFIFHWTFLFELAFLFWAVYVFILEKNMNEKS